MNVTKAAALVVTGLFTVIGVVGMFSAMFATAWYGVTGVEVLHDAPTVWFMSVGTAGFSGLTLAVVIEEL
jgi:hypothetical protein